MKKIGCESLAATEKGIFLQQNTELGIHSAMAVMLLVVMLMSDIFNFQVHGHPGAKHYPVPWDRRGVTLIKQC